MDILKKIICAIIGHSRIIKLDFGRLYCGRCDAFLVDGFMNRMLNREGTVFLSQDKCDGDCAKECAERRERAYQGLTWKDRILAPNPETYQEA